MPLLLFFLFALMSVGAAFFILLTKNLMYMALGLFVCLLGMAGLYVLAGADFLAVTQIMVYVGGVLVLIIFGVMLTNKGQTTDNQLKNYILTSNLNQFWGVVVSLSIFGILFVTILTANFGVFNKVTNLENPANVSTLQSTGMSLLTTHLLPFEIAGILLMVALMGATFIATSKPQTKP